MAYLDRAVEIALLCSVLALSSACSQESSKERALTSTEAAGDSNNARADVHSESGKQASGSTAGSSARVRVDTPPQAAAGRVATGSSGSPAADGGGTAGAQSNSAGAKGSVNCGEKCSSGSDADAGPKEERTKIHSKCGFEFLAPQALKETPAAGDTCLSRYEAEGCVYLADYGPYSAKLDDASGKPNYQSEMTSIDGLQARVVTYGPIGSQRPYFAGAHFPMTPKGPAQKLTFTANCETAALQSAAREMLLTVRFDR